MGPSNPYDSPKDATTLTVSNPMPLLWSAVTVFGTAVMGGLLGLGIGAALGLLLPGYYRSVFSNGDAPNFDPVAVGIGQGVTQGVTFGGVLGLVLVGMFYWYRLRTARLER